MGATVVASSPDPLVAATYYRALFAPRWDTYAEWDTAAGHWRAERAELTPERILAGLRTAWPVSAYMEDAEGLTHVGAIDVDREDGWAVGLRVAATIAAAGGSPYLEKSRRGCHLWLPLDRQLSGDTVRLALHEWVRQTDPYWAKDAKVELYPKRLSSRGPTTVGAPLRLPMMSHPATGNRSTLYTPAGDRLATSVTSVLVAVDQTPADLVTTTARAALVPISEARVAPPFRRPEREGGNVIELLVNAGVERAAPHRTVRCPFHDDRQASLAISADGERVWCKSPACPANNGDRGLGADQLAGALRGMNGT